jgi:glycosyltransferase involved in cell wall biosynthesis
MTVRVLHVISALNIGGAEGMLLKLVTMHQGMDVCSEVVSLSDTGVIGERIRRLGVAVHSLHVKKLLSAILAMPRLLKIGRRFRPSVIQTWMPHADFFGGVAAALLPNIPLVWNIRMTAMPLERRATQFLAGTVNRYLSFRLPDAIVCCAQEALEHYAGIGYQRGKMVVIPNGFDLDVFKPDALTRRAMRKTLGVHDDELLVGIVGRFHPMKDHRTFIAAAGLIRKQMPKVRFLLVGAGLDFANSELEAWAEKAGVKSACLCLGRRDDLSGLYSAMDVNVLSSASGEGFPNVLGEAMACGVPCVATDVGDSRRILGETGRTVSPSDSSALADAITDILRLPVQARRQLGVSARQRIADRFSIAMIARSYLDLYRTLGMSGRRCAE